MAGIEVAWGLRHVRGMTTPNETLTRIRAQREEVSRRAADLTREIAALQHDLTMLEEMDRELEVAERIVAGLLPTPEPRALGDVAGAVVSSLEPEVKPSPRKPPGLPSILEMANEAFEAFEKDGVWKLTCPEITRYIRSRWWPDVKTEFISPQLWRAATRGDILKDGAYYARKGTEYEKGPATEVARPSQSNGETGSYPV